MKSSTLYVLWAILLTVLFSPLKDLDSANILTCKTSCTALKGSVLHKAEHKDSHAATFLLLSEEEEDCDERNWSFFFSKKMPLLYASSFAVERCHLTINTHSARLSGVPIYSAVRNFRI